MPIVGEIRLFAFKNRLDGWHECDGRRLRCDTYTRLFNILGYRFGGEYSDHFNLPDWRNCLPIGTDAPYLANSGEIGATLGSGQIEISTNQIPLHRHSLMASTRPAQSSIPAPRRVHAATSTGKNSAAGVPAGLAYVKNATAAGQRTMHIDTLSQTGQPCLQDNHMPSLGISIRIASDGVYPTFD